ncbi:putative bleomycin hydrolase [Helianthus annuus]|nr:putative bleomycin hydrolase [Helianthus annuus]
MALSAITTAAITTSRHSILSHSPSVSNLTLLITTHRLHYHYRHSRKLITTTMASSSATPSPDHKTTAPYGSWHSPITSDVVSGASKGLGGTAVDSHGRLFWLESRPTEAGRSVIVKGDKDESKEAIDVTPKEFSVRTVAQEYGGGAFSISGDTVVFSNYKDQRLYKQSTDSKDSAPVPLTPDYGGPLVSYADGVFDTSLNRFITVMEDRRESSLDAITSIASIELGGNTIQEPKVLVGGNDFYAFPRLDASGKRLAWIEWSHPNMPWDKSQLWVGYISDTGDVYKRVCVAGGDSAIVESPTEPKWSDEGELFFITDRKSGFWNLHRWVESDNTVAPIYSLEAEFARPLWVFGMNSYEIIKEQNNLIACTYRQKGRSYLAIVDKNKSTLSVLESPFTDLMNIVISVHLVLDRSCLTGLSVVTGTSGVQCLYVEGASGVHPMSIAKVSLDEQASKVVDFKIVWSSSPTISEYKSYFSSPEFIEFPTEVPGEVAYAYYYPPTNPVYQASQDEKPPLLLKSHGGPTAETRGILNLNVQFWTSRGWAFVDVNYGGSTGYGRAFRERLLKRWGMVDVNDCCSCAQFLVFYHKFNPYKITIRSHVFASFQVVLIFVFLFSFCTGG